jgi:hypothetical protein
MIENYRQKYVFLRAEQNLLRREQDKLKVEEKYLQTRSLRLEKLRALIQSVAEQTQKNLEFRISHLVTTALAAVFDDPEEFVVKFVKRRGKTECDLLFMKNGKEFESNRFYWRWCS